MGGNALKNVETRRYQAEEYHKLEKEVLDKFKNRFPDRRVEAIKAYREKESFGDMDLLFEGDNFTENVINVLNELFQPKQIERNSSVWSFEYKNFQIDLIFTSKANFDASANYFAWNDLGNLMGRVAHKLGFKYGHDGLSFVFRDGTYQYAEVNLSKDHKEILSFLDYDYDRFVQGFDNLQQIFEYTTSSKYFNKEIYAFDNRNHASRIRDKKRKTYNEFLQWVETVDHLNAYPWADMREKFGREYKQEFVERAFQFFPDFKVKFEKIQADFEMWKKLKEKFNGDLVREWTGLENRELGNFMIKVKDRRNEMSKEEWEELVLSGKVENQVKQWFKEMQK